jgi:predicted transcriptional regulator
MEDFMEVTVDEFTSAAPITVDLNADLQDAHALMTSNNIRHLPVMDGRNVSGIISERDLMANFGKPWSPQMRVKNIMNSSILIAHANDDLGEVAFRLSKEKKGSAIILDENDELYGIFTTTDALNALVELLLPKNKYSEA